ncbi:hypothetical protein M8494_07190 [Serratia ureilytica]
MRALGESLLAYRLPISTPAPRSRCSTANRTATGEGAEPDRHQKWGYLPTYSDNLLMLTLSRGGPTVWRAKTTPDSGHGGQRLDRGFIANGALTVRGGVSPPAYPGRHDHADVPRAGAHRPAGPGDHQPRGGIHNSVTRARPKPTHMIGGYAQLAYGFNYYGTVGSNRDEFVVVRKMNRIDWLDDEGNDYAQGSQQENSK